LKKNVSPVRTGNPDQSTLNPLEISLNSVSNLRDQAHVAKNSQGFAADVNQNTISKKGHEHRILVAKHPAHIFVACHQI
jgi:hypothetical protein